MYESAVVCVCFITSYYMTSIAIHSLLITQSCDVIFWLPWVDDISYLSLRDQEKERV